MRVAIAVHDPEAADKVVAGALNYGVSSRDEIGVVSVVESEGVQMWSILPPPIVAQIKEDMDLDAKVSVREAGQYLRSELHSPRVAEFTLHGELLEKLNDFLKQWKADLLIIGISEHSPWADHAGKIVTIAPCPVLVIRHEHTELEKQSKGHEPAKSAK
jgi:nucleotide-binding universal stress UspA family protein